MAGRHEEHNKEMRTEKTSMRRARDEKAGPFQTTWQERREGGEEM